MMLSFLAIISFLFSIILGEFIYPCKITDSEKNWRNGILWGFQDYIKSEGDKDTVNVYNQVSYNCFNEEIDSKSPYFFSFHIGSNSSLTSNQIKDVVFSALKEQSNNERSLLNKVLHSLVDEALKGERIQIGCFLAEEQLYYPGDYSAFCRYSHYDYSFE
ncbi:unnamed protein product [Cylicocyclus nassatus]|uniref:Uncharacterized protein n=1 Tax=Cylicocyclus nassatus TaxID=53992 RepID=A0AA36DQA9_CYLNA|nr:unnamed protein product [Cylicocyclus nassatus]